MAEKLLSDFFRGPGKFYSKKYAVRISGFTYVRTPQEFAFLELDNSRSRIPAKPDLRVVSEERMVKLWLPW
jgi:hypothetical protein